MRNLSLGQSGPRDGTLKNWKLKSNFLQKDSKQVWNRDSSFAQLDSACCLFWGRDFRTMPSNPVNVGSWAFFVSKPGRIDGTLPRGCSWYTNNFLRRQSDNKKPQGNYGNLPDTSKINQMVSGLDSQGGSPNGLKGRKGFESGYPDSRAPWSPGLTISWQNNDTTKTNSPRVVFNFQETEASWELGKSTYHVMKIHEC